jgi:hypothetical protein
MGARSMLTAKASPGRRPGDRDSEGEYGTRDTHRRLRGEPPLDQVVSIQEACRWVEIYSEMTLFWEQTLVQFRSWLEEVTSEPVREQLIAADGTLMDERRQHLRRRWRLWEQRAHELVTRGKSDDAQTEAEKATAPPPVRRIPTAASARSGDCPRDETAAAAVLSPAVGLCWWRSIVGSTVGEGPRRQSPTRSFVDRRDMRLRRLRDAIANRYGIPPSALASLDPSAVVTMGARLGEERVLRVRIERIPSVDEAGGASVPPPEPPQEQER